LALEFVLYTGDRMRVGKRHRAYGYVVTTQTGEGIDQLTVEAFDGDRFVARTTTASGGRFAFSFADPFMRAQFGDRALALTIKVLHDGKVLHSGKDWKPDSEELEFRIDQEVSLPRPSLHQITPDWDPKQELKVTSVAHPLPNGTIGTIGKPVEVEGPREFPPTLLRLPYSLGMARGVDWRTARLFRWDKDAKTLRPVWNSGVNGQLGFAWGKIRRAGIYVVLGLPSDKLLLDALATMAYRRRCDDTDSPEDRAAVTRAALAPLVDPPPEAVEQLRQLVTRLETNTSIAVPQKDVKRGRAGAVKGMTLPEDREPAQMRERLREIETPPGGLPEENLFYPPEVPGADLPIPGAIEATFMGRLLQTIERLDLWKWVDLHWWWPWLFSHDWWMYQANERHSGHAMGWSDIRSTNVSGMINLPPTPVAGPVYTKPAIVDGKIYVGTTESANGGTLYKIDLYTGAIDGRYETPKLPATYGIRGVGGSPAVVGGKVYFTSIHGRVYCLEAATMSTASPPPAALWITDLKNPDLAHDQPLSNTEADSWSGPLVVNGNVYVGCGEGETATACGFVYCLDAATGSVKWLFCTNQYVNGIDNQPNVVPNSLVPPPGTVPAGFTIHADPPVRGASVWSSLAYCAALNRVYVGTGNPSPDSPAPNALYSSGCISLDAATGKFKGFWAPKPSESYWPGDNDIDVPGGPIVYREAGNWRVAIGSKSGAFVILNADTMVEIAFRQILPRRNGDGTAANPGTSLPSVVPTPPPGGAENHYGVYGTPARLGKRLFVSMGSDDGIPAIPDGIGDAHKTPFMRVMNDSTLSDDWPTTTDAFGITRYSNAGPPMYSTSETGVGSAAVVNDVVFACSGGFGAPVSIYAFDASTGNPLWHDHAPVNDFCLGAAIYGNYVVIGAGSTVRRYVLRLIRFPWPWPIYVQPSQFLPNGPRSISIPASIVRGPLGQGPVE
jgi:outer membrane protein assembly factor BamB